MRKIKILQAGDLHFDTPFKDLDKNISIISKEELLEVFSKIIDISMENSVDILLLTGDIFDNLTINKKTLIFIKNQIERISNIRVFISPGNHDPYNEKSFYKMINWPDNVYIFKGSIEKVVLEDLNTVVWGAAFNEYHVRKSLLKNINVDNNYINIMTIHGDISNTDDGNEYNPMTRRDIENSKLDYIAIGHRHNFSGILRENNTFYAYAGCPQGRGFDEVGDKGIILGEVTKGAVDLNFIRTSKRNYYVEEIDISDSVSYDEVRVRILSAINEEERKNNLYKLILKGQIESYINLNEGVILEKIKKDFYFVKVIDKTEVKLDFDKISEDYSIKGVYAKKLLEKMKEEDCDKEILQMALKLGIQSLSHEEVNLNDYK
ncbi:MULTISPECIES: metallophosphoesterase family protein [unclassified Clostridium]|uniref:metallophosphoesterase family protein n=1 Tax=unclassified Clostridium TaxID=2614128 RepID=UPI0025C194A4|nr:DNA repair exonuclease [Clostridium sp.]MCI6692312.1 DNA repair exonuclease [Clostridium sp.]MDY4252316.1 DNA repair exonuclease [Clostridium sp.]